MKWNWAATQGFLAGIVDFILALGLPVRTRAKDSPLLSCVEATCFLQLSISPDFEPQTQGRFLASGCYSMKSFPQQDTWPLLMRQHWVLYDIFLSSRQIESWSRHLVCVPSEGANEWIYVVTLFCLVPLYPYQSASLTHGLSVQRPVQYGTLCLETLFLSLSFACKNLLLFKVHSVDFLVLYASCIKTCIY